QVCGSCPRWLALLKKEPAMAFEIFRSISSARRPLFDLGEDRRPSRLGTRKVALEVIHVHEHTIDDPRHRRPPASLFAHLPMALRAAVIRRGRRKHDQSFTGAHLAVREPSVRRRETCRLPKTEGAG